MASVSKADYLKKYLSEDQGGVKKKKIKRKKPKVKNTVIVDDNISWKLIDAGKESGDDSPSRNIEEEKPVVMDLSQEEGTFEQGMWKAMNVVSTARHDTDDDLSPVRRRQGYNSEGDSDNSPPRRAQRQDSDADLSPVRRRHNLDESDPSPSRLRSRSRPQSEVRSEAKRSSPQILHARRQRHDSDVSPVRERNYARSSDRNVLSPARLKRHDSNDDLSPPRAKRFLKENSPHRQSYEEESSRSGRNFVDSRKQQDRQSELGQSLARSVGRGVGAKTALSSGGKAGLLTTSELRSETEAQRSNQASLLTSMDPSKSGRHASTVYRNREGKRIDKEEEQARQKEIGQQKAEQDKAFKEWGRGVAQTQQAQEQAVDTMYEMSKPLARHRDDEDLEHLLKAQERDGDPMLAYLKKKQKVKEGKKKEKPRWKGAYPQNRFDMPPGYRWDGVDRSNGFEKDLHSRKANEVAVAEMAYKWSVEDM